MKLQMLLKFGTSLVVLGLALTGCGRYPTVQQTYKVIHAGVPTPVPAGGLKAQAAPAKSLAVPFQTVTYTSSASGTLAGSLSLAVNVSGTAKVASLALAVVASADATNEVDAPLTISSGTAAWREAEAKAGNYEFKIRALGADGALLGTATTQAVVKAGEPTEVTVDLRVNAAAASDGTPPAMPVAPAPAAGTPPASPPIGIQSTDSTPPTNGQIGLDVSIQ